MTHVLAFDLGASNGRLTAISFDGEKIKLKEIHRFRNQPVYKDGHYYWDHHFLEKEIIKGIKLATNTIDQPIGGIGIDTWGVDFGIVDDAGLLVSNPFSYRDPHTEPFVDKAQKQLSAFDLFKKTGNEVSSINTLFQLMAIESKWPELLEQAKSILMMPNLLQYALTGIAVNEYTIASTSQLLGKKKEWNKELLQIFFQKPPPLANVHMPHQIIGNVSTKHQLPKIPVILTPGHDTACALSALPIQQDDAIFMSVGTWTLIGMEVENPVITEAAFHNGFTNEGTSEGNYRFQKNATGFWILQQLRKDWQNNGQALNYEQENAMIKTAKKSHTYIDPDDSLFFNPSSMTVAIEQYCKRTKQTPPTNQQEMLRCIIESMALKYAKTIANLEEITRKKAEVIHIGGGGSQNEILCQFLANATGKRVIAGPVEASSIGNGLSQLRAIGEIASFKEGRDLVARSFCKKEYMPQDEKDWMESKDTLIQRMGE
ncbi:rhamnulokinase family protein [Bacillus sp. FJAT-50079]|uniref:rhamnulokinase n=1 Tax=Bacillus sp. FJAT-50079 TaxID=2833577 RepID=UPI001BC95D48|nr:rhamnulokinase family protein [Bacillus sp. FJAT-50079]MBS4207985.1 rhamnulokinase [Bacillus sp. FJAT-50079]